MRINRYVAGKTGYSRRKADEFIDQGRVKVNGSVMTDFSYDVREDDEVELDGEIISNIKVSKYYYLFNKPKGVISSVSDPYGRLCVRDFFPPEVDVYPVGRLDFDSTGLLLVTNDGEITNKLTHPKNHISKKYLVSIDGRLSEAQMKKFRSGLDIEGRITAPAGIELYDFSTCTYKVTLYEGRKRQIRNMMSALGRKVNTLQRISIGKIKLGTVSEGKYRKLTEKEKAYLFEL